MTDVVFITPNLGGLFKDEPVGTLLLGTILRNAGIPVEVLQFRHFGTVDHFDNFISSAVDQILARKPKIVSFYTRCDSYHISIKISQCLKQRRKDIYIVYGGPQADLSAEDTIREIPEVDYICCGEGENTIVPFFTSLLSGQADHSIDGLVYRDGANIMKNPRPQMIQDLDSLPDIDYSLLDFQDDKSVVMQRAFPVDVGRGCPFGCTFCSTKNFWGRHYRLKSAERIIHEIKNIHDKFGIENFSFEHDMFTLNRQKVIDICHMLKQIGFPIQWGCSARVDCLDKELIDIMIDAGMVAIFVGIETGSPRMQKVIRKNLKLDTVQDMMEYVSKKGIVGRASFIFGFPNETDEDFSQSMDMMMRLSKLPGIAVLTHYCTFFGGTELTKEYYGRIDRATVLSSATGDVAVKDCEDIISAHPALFPHYFEFKSEFRDKVKYYTYFFRCWNAKRPVYEYLAAKYDKSRLCDMLYDFTETNLELLQKEQDFKVIILRDQFLNRFTEDEKYGLLKEVSRFLLWKQDVKYGSQEVFGFDVNALLAGKDIAQLEEKISFVTYTRNAEGKSRFSVCYLK